MIDRQSRAAPPSAATWAKTLTPLPEASSCPSKANLRLVGDVATQPPHGIALMAQRLHAPAEPVGIDVD